MTTGNRKAAIDVHKKMLAVVTADTRAEQFRFERGRYGALGSDLIRLANWLRDQGVTDVVMESTAQYWKPVWQALEGEFRLHLAQAQSNEAPRGRKSDFADAERLLRRFVAGELRLSFVPDPEQRLWRTLTHTRQQLKRDHIRLRNQLEGLLEEARIKLSGCLSDLLGISGRRMLQALASGETDAIRIAALAETGVRATQEHLAGALQAAATMHLLHRQLLKLSLERMSLLEQQMEQLEQGIAEALRPHQGPVQRLAKIPGMGVDSAQQFIAEVGPQAAAFPTSGQMASWVACCPGREESAGTSKSNRSPKGNRTLRRLLCQSANAAAKAKHTVFHSLYQRLVPRLGHAKAIWAVAHRLCRIAWNVLHRGVEYEEHGPRNNPLADRKRTARLIRRLRALGYEVLPPPTGAEVHA
jgi:transposase